MKKFIQSRNFWENSKLHLTVFLFFLALLSINTVANAQCSLTVINSVTVSLSNDNCDALLTEQMFLSDNSNCPNADHYEFEVRSADGQDVLEPMAETVVLDNSYIGGPYMVIIEAHDAQHNVLNTAMTTFNVVDKMPPVFVCPANDTVDIQCYQQETYNPVVTDNCSPDSLISIIKIDDNIWDNNCTDPNADPNVFRIIDRAFIAVDESGNQSDTCNAVIRVNRLTTNEFATMIQFPDDLIKADQKAISCKDADDYKDSNGNFDPNKTGWPFIVYPDDHPTQSEIDHMDTQDTVLLNNNCTLPCNLASTYIDMNVNTCPTCVEKTVRFWTVVENSCQYPERFRTNIQTIEVVDTIDPVIICLDDQTINTNQFNCEATYTFPVPQMSDECSNHLVWTISVMNDEGLPVMFADTNATKSPVTRNLSVGTNAVTYTVYDKCGNSSQCSFNVVVEDKVEPVAVCQTFTTVALTYDGEAQLPAFAVNSGSYDNCSGVSFLIKRMETDDAFAEYVTYDCNDLAGQPWMVILQVTDAAGNIGTCMVSVEVQDKLSPTITCPDDMEVECDFIYEPDSLLKYFGWPTAHDNCGFVITTDSSTVENACYNNPVKVITRNFTATDDGGRTAECTQTIEFHHTNYFGYDGTVTNDTAFGAIQWPADVTISDCIDPNTANNSNSPLNPANSGWPILSEYSCDQVGYTYDDFLAIDNDNDWDNNEACFKIIRTWTVIDDCHKVNGSFAKWQYDQVIYVTNNVDPVIIGVPDTTTVVCTFDSTCTAGNIVLSYSASDDCTQDEDLRWRYYIDKYNDNPVGNWDYTSPIFSGNSLDASGDYEIGTHKILWQVWDQCGNSVVKEQLFTIQNCKKPTPICIDGLTVDLTQMPNGPAAMIRDTMFDGGSYHTCNYDLVLSFSTDTSDHSKTFTCNDLGVQPITLYVTALLPDGTTTQDYCTTSIEVQDNFSLCSNPLPHGIVSGAIVNEDNEPVENVEISLLGSELGIQKTNSEGKYEFPPVIYGQSYTVAPQSGNDYMNGLSTLDLVYIQKHILGIKHLKSPYTMIASDVNNDKKISASDILVLRKLILGVNEGFDHNNSWKYISSDYNFENPENPISEDYQQNFKISDLESDMSANFIAIKIGDASGDATVNGDGEVDSRNSEALSFVVNNDKIQRGNTIEIPVLAKDFNGIQGFQATISFDPNSVNFESIEAGALNMDINNIATNRLSDGYLPMSWFNPTAIDVDNDAVLFTLIFESNANTNISNILSINSDITKKEAYNSLLEKMNVELEYRNSNSSFELMQNRPNPFTNNTEVVFNMPENSEYEFNIYDITGKLIFKTSGLAEKGLNSININKSQISTTGVLYYTLKAGKYSATKKMVVIK